MKNKKNTKFSLCLLVFVFLAGLSLLLYPTVSNYVNSMHQSRALATYSDDVLKLSEKEYAEILEAARAYNDAMDKNGLHALTKAEQKEYDRQLNFGNNGIMGQIEIPAINVSLPIYHGTDVTVLQIAVGHLDWTSLPVGGKSSHCVLSGHRGLPSAKLFTHLDELVVGDVFILRVLNEVLTYEVDQILIVKPSEIDQLCIVEGEDLCTLVTCTPYGINSHRLLVRGHRIENADQAGMARISAEALRIEPLLITSVVGIPVLMLLVIVAFFSSGKTNKHSKKRAGKRRE